MPHCYRFGQVEVRPGERRILINGQPANVGARAFDVLIALIDRRDRVVSKDELLEIVWPGLVVEENNLQVHVSALRKLLGPQALVTIPGRGYRLALTLETDSGASPASMPKAAPTPAARRHNLPVQLSSFVGRDHEIGEIRSLLGAARLVTLTSTGGTGKTRLSLQVATQLIDNYPDGVWFVELAPLVDERLVPQAVASVLGVIEEAGRPVLDALEKYVPDRQLLLILDNCEHLGRACAELAKTLLRAGRGVQILASSREHLHVAGETTYPLPSLAVPAMRHHANDTGGAVINLEALMQYEAVRLFIDRAVEAQPAFRITQQNATAVADICRHLDGIPLAIELAAARVGALSVEKIAARLGDRFRFLTGGDQTAMPRQQTLRASIDWSYDLLAEPERVLLQRLSVFAGGWTLEAAEAVGAGAGIDEAAVLDLLVRLVEKSLVTVEVGGDRYRLLETVRHYARERLSESGAEHEARAHHLGFYLALAEKARPMLVGPEQGTWLAHIDTERENLLVAHAWADHAADGAAQGLRLVWALKPYCINRGLLGLGQRITVEALGRAGAEARNAARCRGLFQAGQIGVFMGRYAEAQRYLVDSLALARELDDRLTIAASLQPLGMACLGQGNLSAARAYLQEALALARQMGNPREIAAALNIFAQLLRVAGELDAAEPMYGEALAVAREMRDPASIAISLLNLAMVAIERADANASRPMLSEALAIVTEIGSKRMGQSVLEVAAGLAALMQQWNMAARFYGAVEAQAAQTGLHRDPADAAFLDPRINAARHALPTAFAIAESGGRALDYDRAIAEARAWLQASFARD